MRRGEARAGGVKIAYQRQGDGPPLVCLHAMGWDHRLWDPHRPRLSQRHELITFDHRGCGDSDHPTDPALYSADGFAEDLLAVLDALKIERARILGYSMGAVAAMRVASMRPDRVEKLVLVSAMASRLPETVIDRARQVADMVHTHGLTETYHYYFNGPLFAGAPKGPAFEQRLAASIAKATPSGFLGSFSVAIDRPSMLEDLRQVSAPTLIIVGENDTHYLADAERMAARLPQALIRRIAGAGHALTVEKPEIFEDAVLDFLSA